MTPAPTIATSAFGVFATRLRDVSANLHCRARARQSEPSVSRRTQASFVTTGLDDTFAPLA